MGGGWPTRFRGGSAEESALTAGLRQRHLHERWAAAAVALLLSLLLILGGVSGLIDNRLSEMRARWLDRPPTGQIAIVEIDAKSIAALKRWPWSRRHHAKLLNRLHDARASIIAFDVDFSAQSDPAGDRAFADALRRIQPVVLPIFQQRASDDPRERLLIKNRPAPEFGSAWVGGVNILPGRDGVVRDFPAATLINGQIQPSMAVVLAENDRLGDRTFIPDWSVDAERIPRFSFIDVMEGRIGGTALAGKRVIVGATAIELGDRYTIPRFGTVPGVVLQALAAETLLQHRALGRSGSLPTGFGLCLIALILGARYRNFRRSFALAAAAVFLVLLAGPVVVEWRWPVSIDTGALLLATVLAVGLRLIVEARNRIRVKDLRDAESGLPNERALEAAMSAFPLPALSLVAASLDRYDQIRTAFDAGATTALIAQAADRIALVADTQVFRIAPDTLAWLICKDDADRIVTAVSERFVEPIVTDSGAVDVRLTFGIATAGEGSALLFESALAAVTAARAAGNRSQWFQGVSARERRDLSIMGDLRRGIAEGEVFVAYQPKLNLERETIMHAEALVRWQHPTEGLISPDRFLPLAEETGTVRELTRFVLGRVIADCSALSKGGCTVGISVNVSALDITEQGFAEEVARALGGSQLDPSQLTLEITESAIIHSPETALKVLHAVRRLGVRLSVDDYGTGQSTLSYLKSLPVNELKIDKSFVTSICSNLSDRIMVRSTIGMAHELGLSVVAEGVEDAETVDILRRLGCDYVQGFVIGKATTRDALWPEVFGRSQRKVA
jgi:EAL domain-containing protein (putative c-di-GMP-specific phosphodiesterase class I)/CHASE2 domain-containing sensor protein/GGDEF domain-containing protein